MAGISLYARWASSSGCWRRQGERSSGAVGSGHGTCRIRSPTLAAKPEVSWRVESIDTPSIDNTWNGSNSPGIIVANYQRIAAAAGTARDAADLDLTGDCLRWEDLTADREE